jgi:hypothetical protein
MALSNGASFGNGHDTDTRKASTEPWLIQLLGPVQPGADPDRGVT